MQCTGMAWTCTATRRCPRALSPLRPAQDGIPPPHPGQVAPSVLAVRLYLPPPLFLSASQSFTESSWCVMRFGRGCDARSPPGVPTTEPQGKRCLQQGERQKGGAESTRRVRFPEKWKFQGFFDPPPHPPRGLQPDRVPYGLRRAAPESGFSSHCAAGGREQAAVGRERDGPVTMSP